VIDADDAVFLRCHGRSACDYIGYVEGRENKCRYTRAEYCC
jgi:hypothetical protein